MERIGDDRGRGGSKACWRRPLRSVPTVNDAVRSTGVVAYVGLGSNLSDPAAQVRRAMDALAGLPRTELRARSPLYRTAPVGPVEQPEFVNAVAGLETHLSPRALLEALQAIERAHGRERGGTRWGPRILDLDILLYGDECLCEPGLRIPHPEIGARAFVLVPLSDVAPGNLLVPGVGPLAELAERCAGQRVIPLASV